MATYELIHTYRQIAKKSQEDYEKIFKALAQSAEKRDIDGRVCVRDASGEYIDLEQLGEHCGYWLIESQTWDLLSLLLKHRLGTRGRSSPGDMPSGLDRHCSDLKFKEGLMLSDPQFKELNIILNWVRGNAPEPGDLRDTRAAGWAYTKDSVKHLKLQRQTGGESHRQTNPMPEERDLVTELDPDALTRQGRFIAPEDKSFEDNFMKLIFEYLRKGDLVGAMAKCRDLNQYWRAQTLAGGLEAWDDVVDGLKLGMHGVEGNRRRELWKRMCYKLATEAPAWEGAVYGILAGDLESVLRMCSTWEDHLFAHLNSVIETQYYNYLLIHQRIPVTVQRFPIYDAIQHHGGPDARFLPKIIDSLQADSRVTGEAHHPQRILQGSLISERLAVTLKEMSRQVELLRKDPDYEPSAEERHLTGLDISDFRLLRVVVHIVLILESLGSGFSPGSKEWQYAEDVVAGYMDVLASSGKYSLVPLYAGQISSQRASKEMGVILVKVTDERTRIELLSLMKGYAIDIRESLKFMMCNVFEITAPAYIKVPLPNWTGILAPRTTGINDIQSLTEEDETMIRALEWMLLVPELKGQIMQDGCIVYNRFLLTGRLAAARELGKRIPSTSLIPRVGVDMELPGNMTIDQHNEDLSAENARYAVLYMEFEMFVRGVMALEDWKEAIQKVFESKLDRAYKSELEQAYEDVQSYALPIAKTWLIASAADSQEEHAQQLQSIRNIYIPDLILALHNVYTEAGRYLRRNLLTQTLELAAVVGSNSNEGQQILKCFVETGKLREYVDNIAEASRMILGAAQASGRDISKKGVTGSGGTGLQIWNVQ
ncbi:nuclear pore protein 84/107 [Terfezia boudieri ATCC MYA-4762]|uniref:Nuclear pore complex protein n=1 Tax=Terfezia boudieri ATCC MYA-4762 TaxID=1051890 RepID=A0A3N4M340_9PEZI|nr:nuclear pore protein 84/107 [Terfezia boudieri ATCC MYA-4762]